MLDFVRAQIPPSEGYLFVLPGEFGSGSDTGVEKRLRYELYPRAYDDVRASQDEASIRQLMRSEGLRFVVVADARQYEPTSFDLEWDPDGSVIQRFTPDFYLPAYDLYIEITTLNQKLVTKKNRKVRRLRERYPEIRCKVFYQRDYLSLVTKYGLDGGSAAPTDPTGAPAGRALLAEDQARSPKAS